MKRINVVGSSASGKSTFSKQLAMKLGVTYIEMDRLFWLPDWKELDDETFFDKVVDVTQQDAWVLDGNYSRTQPYNGKESIPSSGSIIHVLSPLIAPSLVLSKGHGLKKSSGKVLEIEKVLEKRF